MPNVASVLKQEISRLARKEARIMVRPLRKLVARHRRDGAALKRLLKKSERGLSQLRDAVAKQSKTLAEKTGEAVAAPLGEKWRKDMVRSTRRRLGLSQGDFARLLGVSLGSVNGWETGRTEPRDKQKAAVVALRGTDKESLRAQIERGGKGRRKKARKTTRGKARGKARKKARRTGRKARRKARGRRR